MQQFLSGFKGYLESDAFSGYNGLIIIFLKHRNKVRLEKLYVIGSLNELNNYLKESRVEIDNNLVENAIRPFALGRKNCYLIFLSPRSWAKRSI